MFCSNYGKEIAKALIIILLMCYTGSSVFAIEIEQELNNTKNTNKVLQFFKDTFKTTNTKLDEINQTAINEALKKNDSMGIKKENIFYSCSDLEKYIETQENKINSLYELYKKNPSNIKNNSDLVELLAIDGSAIKDINNAIKNDILNAAYEIYLNTYQCELNKAFSIELTTMKNYYKSQESYYQELRRSFIEHQYSFSGFLSVLLEQPEINFAKIYKKNENLEKQWYDIAKEVSTYSYYYEEKKYNNWINKNHKKQIKGSLEEFVYTNYNEPIQGSLYSHHPTKNMFLQVSQTVPGGVILTGTYIGHGIYGINRIFLQTTKSFADGQIIREPIIAEYKGFYDYCTVLGAKKRIYKFYRLGETEIKKNFEIPGQPLYFYKPF